MLNRIKEVLLREGFASGSFADEIGVQRSSLSHILNGRNKPSLDFILKTLQRFPNINSKWLLMGIGEMYSKEKTELKEDSTSSAMPDLFNTAINESSNLDEVAGVDINFAGPAGRDGRG